VITYNMTFFGTKRVSSPFGAGNLTERYAQLVLAQVILQRGMHG